MPEIDQLERNQWTFNKYMTYHFEAYACTVEDMFNVISSCSKIFPPDYLLLRLDAIAKYVYEQYRMKLVPRSKIELIHSECNIEYWWNLSIKIAINTKGNQPDLIIWNSDVKTCQVVELDCPADVHLPKTASKKENRYGTLLRSMQLLYPDYKFELIPILVGALDSIPTCLLQELSALALQGIQ